MSRPRIMIFVALVFAMLATVSGYYYLHRVKETLTKVEMNSVVLARSDVPAKTLITRSMVEQLEVPAKYIHSRAARRLDDVVGAITREPLVAGEQVLLDRVVKDGDTTAGLSYLVPSGKRAVTVAVDEVAAVGWHLQPGDHVDIIGTVEVPVESKTRPGEKENKILTVVALQDVEVLAVGKDMEFVKDSGKNKKTEVKTVTVAVTLEEAKPLVLAEEEGKIRMLLRSPLEKGKVPCAPFELEDFLYLPTIPEEYHRIQKERSTFKTGAQQSLQQMNSYLTGQKVYQVAPVTFSGEQEAP